MERRETQYALRLLPVIVIIVVAALAGYLLTVAARDSDKVAAPRVSVPRALGAATSAPSAAPSSPSDLGTMPTPGGVRRALAAAAGSPDLGARLLARVADAQTGKVLYDRSGSTPAAPASTAKLMTAVALLVSRKQTDHFATTVVTGATSGTVVLVGGGDPTITGAPVGEPGAYASSARISTLAGRLHASHVRVRRIVVDDTLFTGPAVSPGWDPGDAPSDYAAPITAMMVDGGRDAPTDHYRSAAPELAAGRAFARALGDSAIPVGLGTAPAGAKRLARVYSAPLRVLVEQMLHLSDNVIAEVLARHVAIAQRRAPSFSGGATAIRSALARLGVQVGGGMHDASGLAAGDRLTPATLVAVLRLLVAPKVPALRLIVSGLPVAGWNGTLYDRYVSGSTRSAAGRVRAKTGTLTGVSAIAGFVHDASGRLLVFAFDADRAGETVAAETALDRVASALAGCGCR